MNSSRHFLNLLMCPNCKNSFSDFSEETIVCNQCNRKFEIIRGVLTNSEVTHYSGSFGLQWNEFKRTQLDSFTGATRSMNRFIDETGWNQETLSGKFVLDAGCGAGRFAEVALRLGSKLVAVDASDASFAASENLQNRDAFFIKSDLSATPLRSGTFGYIFCIGVLQHTSHPRSIVQELLRLLSPNGEIVLTFYENRGLRTKLYSKYLIRPITTRIPSKTLLDIISKTSKMWFPITSLLFARPFPLGKFFSYMIPVANYVDVWYPTKELARQEAILDTFDMLSPQFDNPIKKSQIRSWIRESGQNLTELKTTVKNGTLKFKKL